MSLPQVLRNRDFNLYWTGVVLSQIGTRGTVAANLYQVYQLTDSIAYTGLVGAAQAVALLVLSPLGGALADRVDRRRLLQAAQAVAMLVAVVLAWLTLTDRAQAWHVVLSVVLTTAAATFDQPARQALIPALVPKNQIAQAIALLNPSRELAILVGPLLAGLLIAVSGPGLMYVVDAASYGLLVAVLAMLRIPVLQPSAERRTVLGSIVEGARYITHRPLIYNLMALDLSATVFSAYRVLLPAIAVDVLHVGATGYGVLSAAPSAGALLATYFVFRTVERSRRQGRVLLVSTALYGGAALLLAHSPVFGLAVLAAGLLGAFDAMATTIRHAAVQIDTPDELRGRVTAFYQMSSRGGPAIGDVVVGAFAGLVGPVVALTVGAFGPLIVAGSFSLRDNVVRSYTGMVPEDAEVDGAPEPTTELPARQPTPGSS
ncbi:MFS transporter [Micromonospora sp. 4G57]|uniref:MFS transporter n=1 Tax=Micromonospora sicca TaxID=2202420 RepID=A0ABM7VWZ1_9ACTN|nr:MULTISPECIES: MFS transporter [unclassified Micromonospora]MDZ5445018.1 MFS transporter [Micromonospora sp. 4G57]MDZ5490862.1 MFS transporter [Micromonospora sp. 4G53]